MFSIKASDKKCTVCAVGAVLRNKFNKDLNASELDDQVGELLYGDFDSVANIDYLPDALKGGHYLNAISIKFEDMCGDEQRVRKNSPIRKELIQWVKDNIPKEFEV